MKTEMEKMRSGELYCFAAPELQESFERAATLCARMRTMTVYDENYRKTIEDLIPGIPSTSVVNPPFQCDHGTGIVLGENVFVNYNCVMLDAGYIRIGRNTKGGPCCQFYTPQHPIDYMERREPKETAYPITIGEDCWLGGGVVVCPGVTIGNRCVIAAGSGGERYSRRFPCGRLSGRSKEKAERESRCCRTMKSRRLWFVKKSRTFWQRMPMPGMLLL